MQRNGGITFLPLFNKVFGNTRSRLREGFIAADDRGSREVCCCRHVYPGIVPAIAGDMFAIFAEHCFFQAVGCRFCRKNMAALLGRGYRFIARKIAFFYTRHV